MGLEEPVIPPFPNSDHWYMHRSTSQNWQLIELSTGVSGCAGILHALIQRAEQGGSYGVDVGSYFPFLD